jgi:hypothetical protein
MSTESDMEVILARVRTLVALASSSHEEEARSAAVIACRLILEHQLEITAPVRVSASSSGSGDASMRDLANSLFDLLDKVSSGPTGPGTGRRGGTGR